MPGTACWEQETSSCEERFGQVGERRSRKQRTPRKITVSLPDDSTEKAVPQPPTNQQQQQPPPQQKSVVNRCYRKQLRCFLCPKTRPARAYRSKPFHTVQSLLLHKLWYHRQNRVKKNTKDKKIPRSHNLASIKASIFKTS